MSSSQLKPEPVLEISLLTKHYPIYESGLLLKRQTGVVHAVDNVSLTVNQGETLGLVGDSGSGKSTLAKCVVDLETPTKGIMSFNGNDVLKGYKFGIQSLDLALHREI